MPSTRELIAALDAAERDLQPQDLMGPPVTLPDLPSHVAVFVLASRNAARPLLDLLDQCRDQLHSVRGNCVWKEKVAIDALLAQLPPKE